MKIWVVEECENPSTDYYIRPFLEYTFKGNYIVCQKPLPIDNQEISLIFVRYLSSKWIHFVEKNRKKIKKIIYFFDDSLFDISVLKDLPIKYKLKIFLKAFLRKKWLFRNSSVFLVSTEYLKNKYKELNPIVLPPYPIFDPIDNFQNDNNPIITIFYFATASHTKEAVWLYEIVKRILKMHKNVIFEIIGNKAIYKLYRQLDRVLINYPMRWTAYRYFLLSKKRDIGLVPVFMTPFNKGRSFTKFFEITGCGAVGVYSKDSIYEKIVVNGENGLLVINNKEKWIELISELITDSEFRSRLYHQAQNFINEYKKEVLKRYDKVRIILEE